MSFVQRHFPLLLRVTGALTALAGAQFLAPQTVLSLQGVSVEGAGGLFFARHWGLLVACFGVLMVLAASREALRVPVVLAATIEKAALVGLVALNWQEPALAGLHLAAVFDTACVLLYVVWLAQVGKKPSTDR